ncbi:MAG: S-layer homology domain-containing protein [Abditibacteriaceae bacterium]
MQNKTKRLSVLLGLALGAPAVVAPVIMPSHAPAVLAADAMAADAAAPAADAAAPAADTAAPAAGEAAEYPDVPQNHWAYAAINKLSQAGIIEGMPNGTYMGNKPMTRYEFAVAIARILDKIGNNAAGVAGPAGADGAAGAQGPAGPAGADATIPGDWVKRAELIDAINALRNEFAPELKALGVRVDDLDKRVTDLENRLAKPPKLTVTPSLLFRAGSANYISTGNDGRAVPQNQQSRDGGSYLGDNDPVAGTYHQFSYLDFSLRLADRVSDNVTLNAELRSLSGTQEDPWAGETSYEGSGGDSGQPASFYVRQANAEADLGDLKLIIGRQHTKVAQGLLYDNDLFPTDQIQGLFSIGPVNIDAFIGSTNNQSSFINPDGGGSSNNPYLDSASAYWPGENTGISGSGSFVGFPTHKYSGLTTNLEDSESLVHGSLDLFKIAGKPVQLGASYLFSGVADQKGWGADLTVPLFNRNVGIEYVSQKNYANDRESNGHAVNITVPVLRTKSIDLDVAYGKANDDFEYFLASAANPYVRTWGEAIFDRPMALGSPMINGTNSSGSPLMAAKKVWDVNGTLRFIKKLPITLRWYNAKGTENIDLGNVWTVGTDYQVAKGLDLELKYGQYKPDGMDSIKYFRIGANVGF